MLRIAMHSAQCIMRSAGTSAVAKDGGVLRGGKLRQFEEYFCDARKNIRVSSPKSRRSRERSFPPKRYGCRKVTIETSTHRNRVAVSIRAPWGALITSADEPRSPSPQGEGSRSASASQSRGCSGARLTPVAVGLRGADLKLAAMENALREAAAGLKGEPDTSSQGGEYSSDL